MYVTSDPHTFTDTTKGSTTTTTTPTSTTVEHRDDLPSEAMAFNGDFFEDKIEGYQTLYVKGRESMLAEINAYETGVRDGTGITSKRFPARELVIGYLLHAKSNEAFREAYNALNGILYTQDAQIIFNDEVDKYFTGTPEGLGEIEAGRNFVQGEIIIYCADPFKYGLEEHDAPAQEKITYNGTYKAYPRLQAGFNNDCGFCAWFISSEFKNNNKIIQLGDADEEDTGDFTKTEPLIDQSMSDLTVYSGGTIYPNALWDQNVYDIKVNIIDSLWTTMAGTVKYSKPYIYPNVFYAEQDGRWTGISLSAPIEWKSSYENKDWKCTWVQKFGIISGSSGNKQRGGIQVIVSSYSDRAWHTIAAANMYKGGDDTGSTGTVTVHTNQTKTSKSSVDMSYNNSYWGAGGNCSIEKSGSKVSFNLGGLSLSLTDSAIKDMTPARVTIVYLKRDQYDVMTEGISVLRFTKTNIAYTENIKNTFGAGDTVVADCNDGSIALNGTRNDSLGNIGNDWEGFCLYPGTQSIGFSYSDWYDETKGKPSSKITYREVFV